MGERKTIVAWDGKPIEDLTHEELVEALNYLAAENDRLMACRLEMVPHLDVRSYLFRSTNGKIATP